MLRRVNVLRREPKDRSKLDGLCGIIHATLISESYIHVGSSSNLFTVDEDLLMKFAKSGKRSVENLLLATKFAEVMQFNISNDRPVVPGSSIKGNIRSRLELSFRQKNGYVRSCLIRARPPIVKEPMKGMHGWRHFKIWRNVLFEDRGPPCDFTRMEEVCLMCDLFGTTGLKSLIDFSDFVGEGDAKDMLEQLSLEYGMNLMAAKPGSKFDGRIVFHNLSPSELGLLLIGMRIGKSVLLGRLKYKHKASGKVFGKAKYEIKAVELLKESKDLEIDGLKIEGGELLEGQKLSKVIERLIRTTHEEFKEEMIEVDEVAVVEQLS